MLVFGSVALGGCEATRAHAETAPGVMPRSDVCPPPFIQKGAWFIGKFGPALAITPTLCGRLVNGPDIDVFKVEAIKRFSGNRYWHNDRGVLDQLDCYLDNRRQETTFRVEPDRPYVGLTRTLAANCEPSIADHDPPPKP
jgi:hypothetical protein